MLPVKIAVRTTPGIFVIPVAKKPIQKKTGR